MIREVRYSEFIEERPAVRNWIDEHGREILDETPISISIMPAPAPASMLELMHRLYSEMNNPELETFQDAEDFDIPDELGIEMRNTPYEQDFDHIEPVAQPAGAPEKSPAVDNGGGEPVQE